MHASPATAQSPTTWTNHAPARSEPAQCGHPRQRYPPLPHSLQTAGARVSGSRGARMPVAALFPGTHLPAATMMAFSCLESRAACPPARIHVFRNCGADLLPIRAGQSYIPLAWRACPFSSVYLQQLQGPPELLHCCRASEGWLRDGNANTHCQAPQGPTPALLRQIPATVNNRRRCRACFAILVDAGV
jgi:hypothetical protein